MTLCSVCKEETKYMCISCKISICNRNGDCHVPAEEDCTPGWLLGKQVAFCHACSTAQGAIDDRIVQFEIKCASRGFHVYRSMWQPKKGEKLEIQAEFANVHDPFAMAVRATVKGKLTNSDVVGHIPREISRFCRYFVNYGGKLEGRVRDTKYRRSPIPSGGLEIPITLLVMKCRASLAVFDKMNELVTEYYIEPELIKKSNFQTECEDRGDEEDLDEFGPEDEVDVVEQQTDDNVILLD